MRISDWSSDVCSFRSRRPGGRHFCICVPFRTAPKEGVVSRPVAPYNRLMASTKSAPGTTVKYRMPSVHPEGVKFVVIAAVIRSEEHTSELQSIMRISYAVFCLKKKIITNTQT